MYFADVTAMGFSFHRRTSWINWLVALCRVLQVHFGGRGSLSPGAGVGAAVYGSLLVHTCCQSGPASHWLLQKVLLPEVEGVVAVAANTLAASRLFWQRAECLFVFFALYAGATFQRRRLRNILNVASFHSVVDCSQCFVPQLSSSLRN